MNGHEYNLEIIEWLLNVTKRSEWDFQWRVEQLVCGDALPFLHLRYDYSHSQLLMKTANHIEQCSHACVCILSLSQARM